MNYTRIYESLISRAKAREITGYNETHHIIPRCLGGTDEKENLVKLTAREHFVCHLLLTKMYSDSFRHSKMVRAFVMMMTNSSNQLRYFSSRDYKHLREEYSKIVSAAQSGSGNSQFGTRWITNLSDGSSLKIGKNIALPDNCVEGRNKKVKKCECCGAEYIQHSNKKTCSKECASKMIGRSVSSRERKKYENGYEVEVDGIKYASISHAADTLGIGHETARYRFHSNSFQTWKITNLSLV